jgi:hypothetical protein
MHSNQQQQQQQQQPQQQNQIHHRQQPQQQQQPSIHIQQMVKSLQAALKKKNDECIFWRELYTNIASSKREDNNNNTNGHRQTNTSPTSTSTNSSTGQTSVGSGSSPTKRALEEATGYFAMEMANKKLKSEQHTSVMKEKLGKVLEQLSRQQQMCKEKDQQMVLREKQYEMDLARRAHELQMCRLEKDHAVELARMQVKLRYLEQTNNNNGEATSSNTSNTNTNTRRSGTMEIQESKFAQLRSDVRKDISTVREELDGKLDSKVAGLKDDHEEQISRLRLDLEARLIASGHTAVVTGGVGGVADSLSSSLRRSNNNGTSVTITPDKQQQLMLPPQQRQVFDCQGDCDNSKLFKANCPIMRAGSVHKWNMRIKRRNGSPRMGVVSTGCGQLDSGKWLGETGIGWGYSDWGQTWYEGRHIKTDLPRFDEGDKVTFTLDLTGSGTLSASVNDDTTHLLFFDMLAKLNTTTNTAVGGGGAAAAAGTGNTAPGFLPAATLLNSRVEFTDFESY